MEGKEPDTKKPKQETPVTNPMLQQGQQPDSRGQQGQGQPPPQQPPDQPEETKEDYSQQPEPQEGKEDFDTKQYKSKKWEDLKDPETKKPYLTKQMMTNLKGLQYRFASKIQGKAIPILMARNDMSLIAQAKNGEGKTLAYSIPLIEKIDDNKNALDKGTFYPQAIVLCHTRELCHQVAAEISKVNKGYKNIEPVVFLGGQKNRLEVKDRTHVIVGTPGRIIKIVTKSYFKPRVNLSRVRYFVADEADELMECEKGKNAYNYENVMGIIQKVPRDAQVNFFSATFSKTIRDGINDVLNPRDTTVVHIRVKDEGKLNIKAITQFYMRLRDNKGKIIDNILKKVVDKTVIIFVNTRRFAKDINAYLHAQGHEIAFLTGELEKKERVQLIEMFNGGQFKLLIATDVLARGYDNRQVNMVINLDIPKVYQSEEPQYETYMHRAGRTGRFGDSGVVLNLVDQPADIDRLDKIKMKYGLEIEEIKNNPKDLDRLLACIEQAKVNTKGFKDAMQEDDDSD